MKLGSMTLEQTGTNANQDGFPSKNRVKTLKQSQNLEWAEILRVSSPVSLLALRFCLILYRLFCFPRLIP